MNIDLYDYNFYDIEFTNPMSMCYSDVRVLLNLKKYKEQLAKGRAMFTRHGKHIIPRHVALLIAEFLEGMQDTITLLPDRGFTSLPLRYRAGDKLEKHVYANNVNISYDETDFSVSCISHRSNSIVKAPRFKLPRCSEAFCLNCKSCVKHCWCVAYSFSGSNSDNDSTLSAWY
jgi:hypothetical protein